MKTMDYQFNYDFAIKYGVNEAIFCNNLYFWTRTNRANKRHFHDGHYWTYNTMEAFTELFQFWTKDQLRTVIKNCEKKGLIIKGNYNKTAYDRTIWYALTPLALDVYEVGKFPNAELSSCENSQMGMGKIPNDDGKNPTPIPDNKPDNKPDKNNTDDDKRTSPKGEGSKKLNDEQLNSIISNLREATKEELIERSFKAVVKKVVSKYKQGEVNDFRNYLVTALLTKIEQLELRRQADNAKQEIELSKTQRVQQLLENANKEPQRELPFYNWLEE
jgi:hypothetical protein